MPDPFIFGMIAVFERPEDVVAAARRARSEGYRELDAYTPFPVDGLVEALELPRDRIPLVVLLSGIAGCLLGFGMQYWGMAVNYPFNVGNRPPNSWPMFIPITFELTILCAAFGALFGMLVMNGLPRPHHPAFNAPCFSLATLDRFFLCIKASDPRFDRDRTRAFLESLQPNEVADVEV